MQINDEQIRAIVAKSILDALPEEERKAMLERAIVTIITPPKDPGYYGKPRPSELEEAFRRAAWEQVRDIVHELMESDSMKARVREVVTKALTDAWSSNQMIERMMKAILDAISGERDR